MNQHNGWSCSSYVIGMIAIIAISTIGIGALGSSPVINGNGLTWDHTGTQIRYDAYQAIRIAQEQGKTARDAAWNETLQVNVPWAAGALVLVVVAVQAGRTWRHREDRQAETRRLLVAYVAATYLPGERVRIEERGGRLALVDYERKQVIPADVVEAHWRQLPGPRNEEI
jgi:hypothetical protein